jgi:tetratricopeptide (TPR) repeat protein
MREAAPNNPAATIARQFMDARQADGKRLLAIRDDRDGRGRKFYRQLKAGFAGTGLKIFELTDLQSISGSLARRLEPSKKAGGKDPSGSSLKEQSLARVLRIIDEVKELAGEEPFVLSLQNMRRWDRQTVLLVELLLGANGSKPAGSGRGGGFRGFVLALEDDGIDEGGMGVDAVIHHPDTLRLVQPEDYPPATALRTLDSRSVRPLRLCQLAYMPLTLSELTVLEGTEALANIRRCGADAVVEGQGSEKLVRLTDGISLFLTDASTLPPVQLREYHERLLKIFEARGEGSYVHAACFYHAVKAGNVEAVFRWFEPGCGVLLEKGKVDEAASLLKEGLLAASSRQQSFSKEVALRRRLSEIYAGSGQPLQAFQTLCAGDLKGLAVDDWYLVAQTALEAGHLRQAQQAIDGVLNGICLDDKVLLPFKVLLGEIEYMRGSYDQCLRRCRSLRFDGLLQTRDRLKLLNVEGKVYLATRQFKKAEAVFKENMKLASSSPDFRRQAVASMINIAVVRMRLGHYAQARSWLERALKESRREVYYREEAIALENIAAIHHLERNYQKALTFYHRALEIFKVLDCHELLARVANNLGELFIRFGDSARAREMLQYSRSRLAEIEGSLIEGVVLLLSGRIEVLDSNFGLAAAQFSKAEEFFRKSGAQHHLAEALVWKAAALTRSGACEGAEACLASAASIVDESSPLRPVLLLGRGRIVKERGGD